MSPESDLSCKDPYESASLPLSPDLDRDCAGSGRDGGHPRRRLAGLARPGAHGRLGRDRPAVEVVHRRREPRLAGAVRRTIGTRRVRRSPLPAEHVRLRRRRAGAGDVLQRRHRQAAVGAPLQHVRERRPAAPARLVVAGRRSRDGQRLRHQRRRAGDVAVEETASSSGSARSPKSSACGRRTADGCRRRSSTGIR